MKKFKKILAMCMAVVMTMSVMSIGTFAADNGNDVKNNITSTEIEINGYGEGVSEVPPSLSDITIQPYGSSPPSSSAACQNLDTASYSGSVEWMASYMYSNKWVKTSKYKITVFANFRAYGSMQSAIDKELPIAVNTQTKFRLVGSDGSKTTW